MTYEELSNELDKRGIQTNETVYSLCMEDVICVLEDKGWLKKLNTDQVLVLSEFIAQKMELPWSEYVEATLSCHPLIEKICEKGE